MTDTPYTPEDLDEAETPPKPDGGVTPATEPIARDPAHDFEPGSPAAEAPAVF